MLGFVVYFIIRTFFYTSKFMDISSPVLFSEE